ncbi:hypothetical protein HMPREF1991_02580 [Hoylesella loescheii DSM 19665 = JCM 12249 = ATCC 15930]|uniref:Uncharacterized protein n=1 Tax=Hoylesella loescheii DSM 19665 = JCM 12249 = ATCC 15930 TaxID=1122985 RepID=A0A069QEY0_HOYLO|nr:hypothetical protein HMPREF1991_02580 [Hoylesella loescheii DSM 19665 = JCM 12249 = ATCC 15930]
MCIVTDYLHITYGTIDSIKTRLYICKLTKQHYVDGEARTYKSN